MKHTLCPTGGAHTRASDLVENPWSSWTARTNPHPDSISCYQNDSAAWTVPRPPRTISASQVPSQPPRRRRSTTTPGRARQRACLHQRAHVVHAAHRHAALRLLRSDQPAQHQRFPLLGSYSFQPVAKAGTPSPGSTRLSRGFLKQRSRASSPAHTRALRANGMATSATALVSRRSVVSVGWQGAGAPCQCPWCRLAGASCWQDSSVFVAVVALAGYEHRLRRPSGLHRVLFCEVVASHCAKAPFGVAYRWRALSGLQNPPYAKSLRWWLRSAVAMASVRRCALYLLSGLRPVITCVPPPTHRGLAATRHWPPCAGLPVCPPGGRPQSGAPNPLNPCRFFNLKEINHAQR